MCVRLDDQAFLVIPQGRSPAGGCPDEITGDGVVESAIVKAQAPINIAGNEVILHGIARGG